jgi:hypothetical protein
MPSCPDCGADVPAAAIACRSCGRLLLPGDTNDRGTTDPSPDETTTREPRVLQYSHSGRRFLLGYGEDFFGIWDREGSQDPVTRYPRTDEGWRSAWLAFAEREPEPAAVGLGIATTIGPPVPRPLAPTRALGVHPAWWALPVLMGWLGGLIAWLVNRDIDRRIARAMLATGVVVSVVFLVWATVTYDG